MKYEGDIASGGTTFLLMENRYLVYQKEC